LRQENAGQRLKTDLDERSRKKEKSAAKLGFKVQEAVE
jgi:hypothetical protein